MHVPIVPSKRIIETDTEVILLDDVRLCGQLNAKLWEEFSSGNVIEAISIIPASATWFPKTELADWPCVVMSGLKFEQMDTENHNEKKYSEIHSYIAVYLGRDPLRQSQFVQLFQDLGVSPPSTGGVSSATSGGQQWLAGFRRLSRAQGLGAGLASVGPSFSSPSAQDTYIYGTGHDSLDPEFDDIYSIRPPNKKPRLERAGRPSDAQAAWHHSKRRKMDDFGFFKLKGHETLDKKWGSDDEMSE
ncbi:hypothetical protein BGZ74_007830 [Mortierella antarctica]|nr:hypothetical protein BGZ74_007830 [Mortierella antarctica]